MSCSKHHPFFCSRSVLPLIFFIALTFLLSSCYAPDIPVSKLKTKYTFDDSQFQKIGSLQVHYRDSGTGYPVILLHGTGASLHAWTEWTTYLEPYFRVISLDLPAYGLTGPSEEGIYDIDYYTSFLKAFTDSLGIEKFAMAGNSLGGFIAWNYAVRYPENIEKLILIDPAGYASNGRPSLVFRLATNKILAPFLKNFTPKSLFRNSLKEVFYNDDLITEDMVNQYYELSRREGNRQAFIDRARTARSVDTLLIREVKPPTLIMWGENDRWIPVAHSEKFKRDIPDAKLVIYEKTGHLPMEEKAEASAKDAILFLLVE